MYVRKCVYLCMYVCTESTQWWTSICRHISIPMYVVPYMMICKAHTASSLYMRQYMCVSVACMRHLHCHLIYTEFSFRSRPHVGCIIYIYIYIYIYSGYTHTHTHMSHSTYIITRAARASTHTHKRTYALFVYIKSTAHWFGARYFVKSDLGQLSYVCLCCFCQCAYTTKPRDPYRAIRIAWLSGTLTVSQCFRLFFFAPNATAKSLQYIFFSMHVCYLASFFCSFKLLQVVGHSIY